MNRKQYRSKRRSCKLCKPNKMGWDYRFNPRERSLMVIHSREIRAALG